MSKVKKHKQTKKQENKRNAHKDPASIVDVNKESSKAFLDILVNLYRMTTEEAVSLNSLGQRIDLKSQQEASNFLKGLSRKERLALVRELKRKNLNFDWNKFHELSDVCSARVNSVGELLRHAREEEFHKYLKDKDKRAYLFLFLTLYHDNVRYANELNEMRSKYKKQSKRLNLSWLTDFRVFDLVTFYSNFLDSFNATQMQLYDHFVDLIHLANSTRMVEENPFIMEIYTEAKAETIKDLRKVYLENNPDKTEEDAEKEINEITLHPRVYRSKFVAMLRERFPEKYPNKDEVTDENIFKAYMNENNINEADVEMKNNAELKN